MKFYLLLMLALATISVGTAAKESPVAADVAAPRVPTYAVQGYEVDGNTALTPEQIDGVLKDFTGPALPLARVREGMVALQSLYRREGFSKVGISLPRQELTNGIVRLLVSENRTDMIALKADFVSATNSSAVELATTSTTNAPAKPPAPTFAVLGYRLYGNTVLPPEQFAMLTNYTGEAVTLDRLREGLGELQLLYRGLGFATVGLSLPPQQLTNGFVRVQITEGKLADITVTGNRYFSAGNIRRALPSLTTNVILNTHWFQPELDQANANQDRQIYPVISPGPDPGTTAINLKVKDRLPLHGRMAINNTGTPGTPMLRLDSALQYNNLWQLEHQIGAQYTFSPQEMKSAPQRPNIFDQPEVASYSGFYRIPLGFGGNLREDYSQQPVDFGYDQVSRTFRQPAPTGNPDFILYASGSSSENPTRYGPVTMITNTSLADLSSQFSQRGLTDSGILGGRFTLPLPEFVGVRSAFSLGADYKQYESQSFITNSTFFKLYALDEFGNRILVKEQVIPLDNNGEISLDYIPLALGWSASRPDKWGNTSFNVNGNLFLPGLASARTNFQILAGSAEAGGTYVTVQPGLTREITLPKKWSALVRANGQWASAPLINNEQFELGGTPGVRGYQDGAIYGDTGWRVLFDLRAPPLNVGYFPNNDGDTPAFLRCSYFMDYGEAYLLDRSYLPDHSVQQWGTGLGFYLTAGEHFDARLTLGWALLDGSGEKAGNLRAYFSVGCQF